MKVQNNGNEMNKVKMDEHISSFLQEQTNLTFATAANNIPYCSNCFYAFLSEFNAVTFKSNAETRHIQEALANENVSGTITPDKLDKLKIKGIQLTGKFIQPKEALLSAAKKKYYLKYPMALAMKGDLWVIEIRKIKMTDNTLGFGKKLIWERK